MTRSDPILRSATYKDAVSFYGGTPPFSFKGFAAELDGEVVALGGVYYQAGAAIAFSDLKPAIRKHKRFMVMACKMLVNMFDELDTPVFAVASSNEPTAPYLLIRLGFKPTGVFGPNGETMVRN